MKMQFETHIEVEFDEPDPPNQDEVALLIADVLGGKYGHENITVSWARAESWVTDE